MVSYKLELKSDMTGFLLFVIEDELKCTPIDHIDMDSDSATFSSKARIKTGELY